MQLTQEYFEQTLDKKLKQAVAPLATKEDVRREVREGVEALARIIADTVAMPFTQRLDRLEELLTVKDEVQTLKRQMAEIRNALHLSGA